MSPSSNKKFRLFRKGLNYLQCLFKKNQAAIETFNTASQHPDLKLIAQSKHIESSIENQFKPYRLIDSDTMNIFKDFSHFINLLPTVTDDLRFNSIKHACIYKDRIIFIKICSMFFYKTSDECVHVTKYFFTLLHDNDITYIGDIKLEGTDTFQSNLHFTRINFKHTFTGENNFEIVKKIINAYQNGSYHLLEHGILLGKYSLLDLHYPAWKEIGFPKSEDDVKLIQMLHY